MGVGGVIPDPLTQGPEETPEEFVLRAVQTYKDSPEHAPQWVKDEIKRRALDAAASGRNDPETLGRFRRLNALAVMAAEKHIEAVMDPENPQEPDRLFRDLVVMAMNHESKVDVERAKYDHNSLLEEQRHRGELELQERGTKQLMLGRSIILSIEGGRGAVPDDEEEDEDEPEEVTDATFTVPDDPQPAPVPVTDPKEPAPDAEIQQPSTGE